jgi:hypothetical protein
MEVFSAMLGENDTMNIYCMNRFESSTKAGPELVLKGKDGIATNVDKVHKMITPAGNTPFNAVRAAYNGLTESKADEKWLVVLTDGEFQGIDNINDYFAKKSNDVSVMFLGMGASADGIDSKENKNIFFVKAKDSKEILSKITDICTRVFNSNRIPKDMLDIKSNTCTFDIPMSELTIFAQGANVSINGIKDSSGNEIKSSSQPVAVKYSEKATTSKEYSNFKIDKSLVGSVATFSNDFDAGTYTLDVTGAETIEVYYKPNIEISALLKDKDGKEVTDLNELEAGDYNIEFFFVKSGTNERISDSLLLGNVSYEAIVTNNGKQLNESYESGDSITLSEGNLSIDVIAHYLDYNTVSTTLDYTIFKNKEITYEVVNNPTYSISTNSIDNGSETTQLKLLLDGKEFTDEQWDKLTLPAVSINDEKNPKINDFEIQKGELGIINISPVLKEGKTTPGEYGDVDLVINSSTQVGSESWTGKTTITIPFDDSRSWIEKNIDKLVKGVVAGFVLFLTLGYIPPFKKYLPKSLKKRPKIDCKFKDYSLGSQTAKGKFIKDTFSTICPYRAQRGTIVYAPSGSGRAPSLKVRAKNSSRMIIINQNAFKGRDDITFNGTPLVPSKKAKEIGAGVVITFTTPRATYTCIPKIK